MSTDEVRATQPIELSKPHRAESNGNALASWLVARDVLASAEGHDADGEIILDRSVDVIRARNTLSRERVLSGLPSTIAALDALENDEQLLLEEDERDHL